MSTRANVKIIGSKGEVIWLYKHHDGYPTHTGWKLEFAFHNNDSVADAVNTLIKDHKFETTTEQHGDINWFYNIKVSKDEWTLEITEFHYHFDGEENLYSDILNPVNKVQDERFSWTGSKSEVWTKYKMYEMKEAIKEAKHKLQYYENRNI